MDYQKLKKAYSDDPEMLKTIELREQTDLLRTIASKSEVTMKGAAMIKGDKGDTPVKGVDYFTPTEIESVKKEVTPIKGVHYFTPDDIKGIKNGIKDEVRPVKGVDYFDGEDGDPGEDADPDMVAQMVLQQLPPQQKIDEGALKKDLLKDILSKIPEVTVPTVKDIIKELKTKQHLEPKDIKGMPINMNDMRWHGGGLSTVSHDSTLTGSGTPASPLKVVGGGSTSLGVVTVQHIDGTITPYNPTTNTDIARGTALLTAMAAAVNKDTIYLNQNTFDIQTGKIDLTLGNTGSVSLIGAGKYSTIIKCAVSANMIVNAASNSTTSDLSLIVTSTGTTFTLPWGNETAVVTNAVLRNVYINGRTDGIYFENGDNPGKIVAEVYDCDIDTKWDGVFYTNYGTINIYNSRFTAVADVTVNSGNETNAVKNDDGQFMNLFNCQMSASGASGSNYGVANFGGFTTIYGGSTTSSGTGDYDINFNGSGSMTVTTDTIYQSNKVNGLLQILTDNPVIIGNVMQDGTGSMISDGSGNVTGVAGTLFTKELQVGMFITCPPEGTWGRVTSITSDTSCTIFPDIAAVDDTFQYARPAFNINTSPNGFSPQGTIQVDGQGQLVLQTGMNGQNQNGNPGDLYFSASALVLKAPLDPVNGSMFTIYTKDGTGIFGGIDYLGRWWSNPGLMPGFGPYDIDASMQVGSRTPDTDILILRGQAAQDGFFLRVQDSGGDDLLAIDGNGQLGIGGDPSYPLDVFNTARFSAAILDSTSSPGTSGYVLTSTGIGALWAPASSGSGFQLPLTGAVNGTNKTFTWTTAPNALGVDGGVLQKTEQTGGTVNWTGTTTTVLAVAPTRAICALA